ncbi:MAG: ABC transporter permease [Gemmobacter sp.]
MSGRAPVWAGGAVLALWGLAAALAPWIAPHDPTAIDFMAAMNPRPSAAHPLGTDLIGRDLLSRLIWGARTTYAVVPLALGAAFVVGIAAGAVAGYRGGWVDAAVSRLGDVILAFPALILYVILITTWGPSVLNIVIAVTLAYAPGVARLTRAQVMALRNLDYVRAAEARGEPAWSVVLHEILPNARGPLLVDLALRAGYTVILIGTLGFLGLGLPPPTPDWGGMVVEGAAAAATYWHMAVWPSAAIASVVVACNLIADGLREGGA